MATFSPLSIASAYSFSFWRHWTQLSGPSIMAGRVVETGAGAGAGASFGALDGATGAAGIAGALMGAAAALATGTAGSAAAGALDATFGAGVDGTARSVDGERGGAAASSGMGVCISSGRSASSGRRGRFFLRGGL